MKQQAKLVTLYMNCDIHTHAPANTSSTNFKFPNVPICYQKMFYKLSWAWAWM